ncbi:MAG: signal peptidase I [Anaerovoracaceae bacterium]
MENETTEKKILSEGEEQNREQAEAETSARYMDRADNEAAASDAAAVQMSGSAENKKNSKISEALSWVRDIVIAIIIAVILSQFITPTIVKEHSMDDTLHSNDYLIMWKMAYKTKTPEYGDIVVFRSDLLTENGKKKLLIKRVIATGGDTIAVRNGYVYRNGEQLEEPYTKDGYTNGGIDETVVPEGKLFLLGDNRVVSIDSRDPSVGFVDEDLLVGKAVLRLYPFNKIGGLYGTDSAE